MRIFQLAKEIGIDAKALVELCNQLGIISKGSPLANLDDAEAGRIRDHVAKKNEPPPAAPAPTPTAKATDTPAATAPPAPERSAGSRDVNPMRQIGRRRPAGAVADRVDAPAAEEQPQPMEVAAEPIAAQSPLPAEEVPAEPVPAAVDRPAAAAASAAAAPVAADGRGRQPASSISRGDYIPHESGGRVRDLSSRRTAAAGTGAAAASGPGAAAGDKSKERRKKSSREPVINLNTKIPRTAAPPPPAASKEPEPMRPDVRLTPDMIAGSGKGKGMNAPLENFIKTENAKAQKKVAGSGALSEFKANAEKTKAKGKKGTEEEERAGRGSTLSDMRRERKRDSRRYRVDDSDRDEGRRSGKKSKKAVARAPRKEKVQLELPCTVRSFSEAAGVPAARVLRSLMGMGNMLNINAQIDPETAMFLATELGVDLEFKQPESVEETLLREYSDYEDDPSDMEPRPPVVTFLGHVDHGKTSLLDYLIGTRIVTGEAGGITQHIRAYQVTKDGRAVSFVDTPGHEAFTEMRARGANVTDIAVLVIAADDGIMPQTQEAISHAKAAQVPIVVAANKIDLPGADLNRVMTQMTEYGLTPSAWGGDVEVVGTSAITGEGMDDLLETLLTVAEINDYQANPKRPAGGICIESEQASDRGVIAKLIVQSGTLRVGDCVVCGSSFGRIKAMYDTLQRNKQLSEAGPSVPVNITGLEIPPEAGERFYVVDDIGTAREIASSRASQQRQTTLSGSTTKVSFEAFQERLQSGRLGHDVDVVDLNIIIRSDVRGSLEAIEKELSKLVHPEVEINILQRSVGGISVADVTLAHASDAVIVGFNVVPDEAARILADERGVELRRYDIIYNLTEDIKALIEGRLKPEERVVELGRAVVKQVFTVTRVGTIAGCYVIQGSVERGCRIRVNRDGRTIGDYALDTLKRVKDDVKEVPRGLECGIKLANFNDIKQDDLLEAYRVESVARKLDQ